MYECNGTCGLMDSIWHKTPGQRNLNLDYCCGDRVKKTPVSKVMKNCPGITVSYVKKQDKLTQTVQ